MCIDFTQFLGRDEQDREPARRVPRPEQIQLGVAQSSTGLKPNGENRFPRRAARRPDPRVRLGKT